MSAPTAVTNLVASRISDTGANLTWTNNSASGTYTQYTSVTYQQQDNVTNAWSTTVALSNPQTVTSALPAISTNRKTWFMVTVRNSAGESSSTVSNAIQTSPSSPPSVGVSGSGSSVYITWSNGPGAGYDYETLVERSSNGGSTWTQVATIAGGSTSTWDYGTYYGNSYSYRVRHRSTDGGNLYSAYTTSGSVYLQSPPSAPTVFTATRNSDTSVSLAWTPGSGSSSTTVQRWDSTGNVWTTIANVSGSSLTDTGTVANRKYQYRVSGSNGAGSSSSVNSAYIYMTPAAPNNVSAIYTGGTTITAAWTNQSAYSEYSVQVTPYKNGVAQTAATVASGGTSYSLTGIDVLATYYFEIRAVSTTGSLASAPGTSNNVMGATAPNAPTGLNPSGGAYVDLASQVTPMSWTHAPSVDGSAQTKYEIQHRLSGGSVWTSAGAIASASSTHNFAAGQYANGNTVEWQVRTWGVYSQPGPWSSTATMVASPAPSVTIIKPTTTHGTSVLTVEWAYFSPSGFPQAAWQIELKSATAAIIESQSGVNAASITPIAAVVNDGETYTLTVKVQDTHGTWSPLASQTFVVDYIPPAESVLAADYDETTGVVVLTLTPTMADLVTTMPATSATIERQIYDPELETYADWEVLAENVPVDATLIDTTAPIHGDGHYRTTTYANAASYRPVNPTPPSRAEEKWLYVSGGDRFDVVCRMWANVEIGWKASRTKALHYFAGRKRPVLYSGESSEKVLTVSGLITDDASDPQQWLRLAQAEGPVLLRAPGNRRIYGSLSEINVDRIGPHLHSISFSIQEVYRP